MDIFPDSSHTENRSSHMKRTISLILICALVVMLTACGGSGTRMTMGTGGTAGTYYALGGVLGQYLKNQADISVTVVATDGSRANIESIDAGDYQLGMVQSDVMSYAWEGTRSFENVGRITSFRTVAGLYGEAVQLVSLDPAIRSVADLQGRAVSIGAPGSGVYFNAVDVLAAAGLSEGDIQAQYLSHGDSVDALKDGKIDAAFVVAGAPAPTVTELSTTNDVYFVPIEGDVAQKLIAACPFYTPYTIPAGTYPGQEEAVNTVTVKATLIVTAGASDEDVYNLTKVIFENAEAIARENSKGSEFSLENATTGITVPFHPGAARYFAEMGISVVSQ